MARFEIVFQGQVQPGTPEDQARARIGQLFQVAGEQLDMLFSGRRIVIKQGLDEAAAAKYRTAIERAGALCSIELMEPAEAVPASALAPAAEPAPTPITSGKAAGKLVPRDEYMAAFADVEAPDFDIAPLGADLQDDYEAPAPLPIDLSALSLAPVGSDMGELKRDLPEVVPNTDHLKLQDD
ncbi:hypothetical protein SAMN05216271_3464 [Halopseudomonas sabulinigri]|uniref:Uncharacterized protein n=1 Tax=Halopseudomonas sabulinigri TaxID=472181 RepID=A0A1H1X806_9GAMM|nr:hypothetical protein [Halopseudomonas sabulinigri]SDT05444.1 hypothetical protein SAMN05216271_3464 [Halopseudomonas sabulinigri]